MRKKILIIIVAILLSAGVAMLSYKQRSITSPANTGSVQQGANLNELTVTPQGQQAWNRENAVAKLKDKVPAHGAYFSFDYSYKTGFFTLTIAAGNQQQGNQEFDLFLRANGVDDRSWIRNLQTIVR